MKIVVIGGTGLIGSKLVNKVREYGHQAVSASPDTGVNTLTEALEGAAAVVDVSNSPSFEDTAVLEAARQLIELSKGFGTGRQPRCVACCS